MGGIVNCHHCTHQQGSNLLSKITIFHIITSWEKIYSSTFILKDLNP